VDRTVRLVNRVAKVNVVNLAAVVVSDLLVSMDRVAIRGRRVSLERVDSPVGLEVEELKGRVVSKDPRGRPGGPVCLGRSAVGGRSV
jgi:hypothetical protein